MCAFFDQVIYQWCYPGPIRLALVFAAECVYDTLTSTKRDESVKECVFNKSAC